MGCNQSIMASFSHDRGQVTLHTKMNILAGWVLDKWFCSTDILKQFKIEAEEFHPRGRANCPNRSHQGALSGLDFDLAQVGRLCRSVSKDFFQIVLQYDVPSGG